MAGPQGLEGGILIDSEKGDQEGGETSREGLDHTLSDRQTDGGRGIDSARRAVGPRPQSVSIHTESIPNARAV